MYKSVYVDNTNEVSNWFIMIKGDAFKTLGFIKFQGTLKQAEEKTDEIDKKLWKQLYGDEYRQNLHGHTLLLELYSEVE